MQILKSKIIGVALFLGLLLSGVPMAHAIYSPVLSKEVGDIKEHVLTARQQNGVGSWLNAMEKVNANNKALKEANPPKASGIPGLFKSYWDPVQAIFVQGFKESFADGFLMLFYKDPETKGTITACLRDDIWEMQALQEQVLNELFKSALLNDSANSAVLWADYNRLQVRIDGNVDNTVDNKNPNSMGLKKNWTDGSFWFPGGGDNYYDKCPFGDLAMAIEAASTSLDRLFSGDTYFQLGKMDMATLWAAAKTRAVKRAADWIKKNQLKVSFGGTPGANPEGLISKDLGGDLGTAYDRAVSAYNALHAGELIGTIGTTVEAEAAAFAKRFKSTGSSSEVLAEYQKAWDTRKRDLTRISNALTFSIQLNHVSEQSLIGIEAKMLKINDVIKEAITQNALPKFCEELNKIPKKQCPNKAASEPVSCK